MKKNLFSPILLLLSLVFVGGLVSFFIVKNISCQIIGQPQQKADEVCEELVFLKNKSIFFFNFENDSRVKEALFNEDTQEAFFIKNVSKSLSGDLNYIFTTKPPLYRLIFEEERWLVTMAGKLRKDDERIVVAEVVLADKSLLFLEDGSLISNREEFLRQLLEPLQEQNFKIEGVVTDSLERVILNIEGLPSVILDFSQDGMEQSKRLKIILENLDQFEVNEKKLEIREIDLRFELPIMRTHREVEAEVGVELQTKTDAEIETELETHVDNPEENLL